MTMDYIAATRNAGMQAHIDAVDAGASFGQLQFATDNTFATILATFTLQKPSYSTPVDGLITVQGLPLSTTFSGTGTITHGREVDSDGNPCSAGTATGAGGGGDYILDTVSAATGLPVNLVAGSRVWASTSIL